MNPTGQPFAAQPPPPAMGGPKEAVNVPSILLMVMAGLGALFAIYGLLAPTNTEQLEQLMRDPNVRQFRGIIENVQKYGKLSNLLGLVLDGVMFYGALQMRNLKSYGLAMAAAIIAMLPCAGCCCLIGLPLGIWALVVLNKPDVKAAFT